MVSQLSNRLVVVDRQDPAKFDVVSSEMGQRLISQPLSCIYELTEIVR